MKKFISVCLVASMVASMGVTAFADDNKYEAKDKDLKFHDQLLYDGRGSDELWLPIVVDKNGGRFVSDGKKSAQDIADDLYEKFEDAKAAHTALSNIMMHIEFQPFEEGDFAAIDEWVKDQLGSDLPVVTVSHQKTDGSEWATNAEYIAEVVRAYTMGLRAPLKAYESAAVGYAQVIDMLGGDVTYIGSANKAKLTDGKGNYTTIALNADGSVAIDADKTPIDVDDIEDAADVEIKWKAKRGGNLVADVYIDEVDDLGGLTCVVFELTDHLGIAVQYIDGELKMESGKNRELDEQDIRYNYYGKAAYSVTEYQQTVGDIDNGYEVNGNDNYINLVDFNQEYHYVFFKKNVEWVEIEDNQGFYYEVDVAEQGKINLVYNNEAIDAVTDIASTDAVLAFYNFEARPTFDFSGKVTLTPPDEFLEDNTIEELHLYTYEKDGSLKPVKQAKVGEDGDTLEFRTATLGKYVLSTEELTLLSDAERATLEAMKEAEAKGETVEPVVEDAAVVVDENKANPGTGC